MSADAGGVSASNEGLGGLPQSTLAEIRNPYTLETALSETGTAYYGSNWFEVRKLYTADQLRAYAAEQVAAERERCAKLCDAQHDSARTSPGAASGA